MENCKRKIYVHEVKKGARMQARDRQKDRQAERERKILLLLLIYSTKKFFQRGNIDILFEYTRNCI